MSLSGTPLETIVNTINTNQANKAKTAMDMANIPSIDSFTYYYQNHNFIYSIKKPLEKQCHHDLDFSNCL
jgi:hypothetical protein